MSSARTDVVPCQYGPLLSCQLFILIEKCVRPFFIGWLYSIVEQRRAESQEQQCRCATATVSETKICFLVVNNLTRSKLKTFETKTKVP